LDVWRGVFVEGGVYERVEFVEREFEFHKTDLGEKWARVGESVTETRMFRWGSGPSVAEV